MNELREAAQAVVDDWDNALNFDETAHLIASLRAALAQPEQSKEESLAAAVQQLDEMQQRRISREERLGLAQPETEADNGMTVQEFAARIKRGEKWRVVTEEDLHPPRDEWRLASEPPTGAMSIEINVIVSGHYDDVAECWRDGACNVIEQSRVIGWRDVQPPTEGA